MSATTYECPVHLPGNALYSVTSPRTGRTITLPRSFAPVRFRGRVVQAVGSGRRLAVFTAAELREVVEAERRLQAEKVAQRTYYSWRHARPSRRARTRIG